MKGEKSKNKRDRYEDIIYLPRPVSKNHPPMPLSDRAAQFAPFAALSGHHAALKAAELSFREAAEEYPD